MTAEQPRTYGAAHFALELGEKDDIGLFRSIEGGGVRADVMTHQTGGDHRRFRQLGKPKFEDIKLQIGMAMSKSFYDWVAAFFSGQVLRKNGAIVAADFYYKERARREFRDALIKDVTFPKLDAQDKNAIYMNVTLAPEELFLVKSDSDRGPSTVGQRIQAAAGMQQQKLWTASNFELSIDGIPNEVLHRVTKIDSFTVKQDIIEYHSGGARTSIKVPGRIDFPNLTFYLPEIDAELLLQKFKQRAIDGKPHGAGPQFTGMIRTFDNDRNPLIEIAFTGADLLSATPDKSDAGSEDIKQVKFELFTEGLTFAYKPIAKETA